MGREENLASLINQLEKVPGLTAEQRDVLTSDVLINRIMPLMTAFVTENVTKTQEVKDKTGEATRGVAEQILKAYSTPKDVNDFMANLSEGLMDAKWVEKAVLEISDNWFFGPIIAIIIAGIHVATTMVNYVSVSSERTRQIAAQDIKPYLLDLDTLTEEFFRNPQNYRWVWDQIAKMGISDEKREIFFANKLNLTPLDALRLNWFRDEIGEDRVDSELLKMRFKSDDLGLIKRAMKVYPGTSDFVTFAVREVFDPEFVISAGLSADMPQDFIDEVKKTGLDENYARMYWQAHWRPPAVNQAFEMFHRQVIDEDELNTLLRIADIMPNMRPKLTAIAYQPITRVDIRRLFEDGSIDYGEMVRRYRDIGYNPDDAELLADWTEIRYGEERRERTKADIIKLYKLGTYDTDTIVGMLQDIGYPEDIAQELVWREDLEKAEKRKNNKLKLWKKAYLNNFKTSDEVRAEMLSYGMQTVEINDILEDWEIDKTVKLRLMSKEDIGKMVKKGLLTSVQAMERLTNYGYSVDDSSLLVQLWEA